ncbi:MAG: LAGLIDADG family homing endonuclease [Patescibacteria group bacterium]
MKRNIDEYISGFVDGEGCFSVSFSRRNKLLVGWETKPSFSVSQNHDRAEVLFLMQKYFNCGFIRRDFSDKTLKYEVRSLDDLLDKVIPHFEKFKLLSGKQKDFELFAKICRMMRREKHKVSLGLRQIMKLAFQMNASGKRKYTQEEIVASLGQKKI